MKTDALFARTRSNCRYVAIAFFLACLTLTTYPALAAETDSIDTGNDGREATAVKPLKAQREDAWTAFSEKYLEGRLRLGTRMTYRHFTDADSGASGTYAERDAGETLLGTIYKLDEEQSYLPVKFFISYDFIKYLGVELSYDTYEAKTLARDGRDGYQKTDGNLTLSGPILSLIGRLPNSTAFTPYVGIGVAFYSSSFDEDPAWARTDNYGTIGNVRTREMSVDNVTALVLSAGVTWNFTKNWFIDCSVQGAKADPNAEFVPYDNGKKVDDEIVRGHFPTNYVAIRLGIGYTF